jgi:UDP-glucose 4-epimerase
MKVLLTGATGFVGRTLTAMLAERGFHVRAAVRGGGAVACAIESIDVGSLGPDTAWNVALEGIDAVVHLAARAHVLHDTADNAGEYFRVNAQGTQGLAQAAARAGVRRFVFLSSVKVNGEETTTKPFTATDIPAPLDPYGESKLRAEHELAEVARGSQMRVAIVRSPLVYGPGVRANFLRLLKLTQRGVPLPLGGVDNRRSLVSVWNLCDLLALLLESREDPCRTWMVSDGEDVSTAHLIRSMARAFARPARLVPVPLSLLRIAANLTGKSAELRRLCGSLQIDISATRSELGWNPPVSFEQGIDRTVSWFRSLP